MIPTAATDTIAKRFARLRDDWLADVAFSSSMHEIVNSKPYQDIIMMGWIMVPLILKDLRQTQAMVLCALSDNRIKSY